MSKRANSSQVSQGYKRDTYEIVVSVLSVLGFLVSAYLSYLHFTGASASFCTAGSGCDVARESHYSEILGVPVALFGVFGYLIIFALTVSSFRRNKWLMLYTVSLAGVAFSAYLTYVEFFVINAICPYCIASAVIMTAIFIVSFTRKNIISPEFSMGKLVMLSVFVTALVVGSSIFLQSPGMSADATYGTGSFKESLAEHLGDIGATMYGSYKCPHCLDQKRMFGDAFEYIEYVECHPAGENANPSRCISEGIRGYPTWEINGSFYEGMRSLEELSKISGYDGEASSN